MVSGGTRTRTRLLDAGRLLISHHGFAGMGINELLQAANVSRGSFYHHFESKEGLGLELLRECFDVCFSGLRGLEDAPRLDSFTLWLRDLFARCLDELRLIAQLSAECPSLPSRMQSELVASNERSLGMLASCIGGLATEQRQPAGLRQRAVILYGLWLGMALLSKSLDRADPLQSAMVATQDLLSFSA
ncbi:hypothetical protein D480_0224855 [Pseudomonas aeruginosa]|uniref:TetR/AcrR family transcriptional regulator n=1 Tax=Pseudomonas aeruginosa TaxID=287 RepID=UPI000512F2C2|nr:TetR/AcrR family transcriptional regulator [Pseudomonas aeruginosa]KHE57306.1 hypothetical protein D480_0224855 [Pseudomonas aeruginosa]KSP86045.1 TetR family transcriptional regulator [Pseudomonas aeruginosa]WNZ18787.1 TetR/AcrR family transcriptional regulator [Pseudomonas aeruginosa]